VPNVKWFDITDGDLFDKTQAFVKKKRSEGAD
jgi:hypothetical protein